MSKSKWARTWKKAAIRLPNVFQRTGGRQDERTSRRINETEGVDGATISDRFISWFSINISNKGVAILARTVFLESKTRYETLFKNNPPTYFAQFVERVPMVKGRLDASASTATGYAWFVWIKDYTENSKLIWIPPCRKLLEKNQDYINPLKKNMHQSDKFVQDSLPLEDF